MPNRLAKETSPYLQQHQDNPVNWYPWGPEAFARARAEDRPILLSVGYSACHWCHVMAHESFEDEETARLMNDWFVNVKVDREERPDVDSIYMNAVQQMTGQGGWPMTVFLTPQGVPFYGGTYFPPTARYGRPSFQQVLAGVHEAYGNRRETVEASAAELHRVLRESAAFRPPASALGEALLDQAYQALVARFDEQYGGFGGAPKFPQPMAIEFLLRYWARSGSAEALRMAEHSLRRMWRGGMYDHLGGGFHRYSVDARWLVPHFEKMLYDNALLGRVYLHAHQATGEEEYRRVTEEILGYVRREMLSAEGGFYSAQDADSEGVEGKFYVWSAEEVDRLLEPEDAPLFRRYYDVTPGGNFEGQAILHPEREAEEVAEELGVPLERLEAALARGRAVLFQERSRRVWPGRDEKVVTAWNAMMLRTFAEAARMLGSAEYREVAERGADFLLRELRPQGRLLRTYRDGAAKIDAFLEDHALLADALVSLYEATFDPRWMREALALADTMLADFWDEEEEVFYDTRVGGEALVIRPRDFYDNATPSGNSAAATVLLRLSSFTGNARYEEVATLVMESMAAAMARIPTGFGQLLCALDFYLSPRQEVAIAGEPESADTRALLEVVNRWYLPNTVLALRDPAAAPEVDELIPLLAQRGPVEGNAAAYVCQRFACRRPATTPEELDAELLDEGEGASPEDQLGG